MAASGILKRFKPEGLLGVGPLGKIYAATERATGRRVAFRGFIKPQEADDAAWQAAIDRYTEELTAAQKLDHPSINRLYEFGEDEGIYYVVSEWFEGEPLRKKIDQKVRPNSSQALNWIGQAGRALDEAAQAGACHGDVTPYNLVVLQDGSVKVVNFGLGHCRPKEDSIYRAPEQIFGDEGDPRSDLFCLGLLLYELLEGRHPFGGGSPKETQDRIVWGAVPPLTDAQPHLEAILQKLLAKRAVERYQTWAEAAADLAQGRAPTGQLRSLDDALPTAPGEASPSLAHFQLSTSDVLRARRILQERAMTAAARRRRAVFRVVKAAAAAALVVWLGRGIQRVRTENTVTLEEVKGDVRVTSFSAQPRKAVAGSRLKGLDVIRTGRDATARLSLGDGARLLLAGGSALTVREVRTRPKSKLRARVFMLAQGTVYSRVRHRKKQQFTVRTPFGSATAKGTDFVVTIAGDRFRVQTAAGVVETATDEGSVRVAAGQQTLAAADRPPAAPEQVSAEHLQAIEKALSQLGSPGGTEGLLAALVSLEDAVFAPLADLFSDVSGLANLPFATLKQGSAAARAQTAMQALIYALEMGDAEGTYPATLNPTTLEEISPSDEMRERILAQFRDKKLEYYKRTSSGYEVAARMLDENGTLIIARTGKVSIQKQEE